ncbi:MAG: YqzL family protein [Clostridiales bacterium]|nr:YqzL family protein [Clostridiales bacterium]
MKDEFDFNKPLDSAWELFEKTGNISYYLLYKKLSEK